jgi:signal transduction histidine kinase/DNA-binding NarL/FixJ family response regulator
MKWSLSFPIKLSYVLVILLLLATPSLLVWQHYGMTRTLEISPRYPHGVKVVDDRDKTRGIDAKGTSVGALALTPDAIVMHCFLRPTVAYPFCSLVFQLGDPVKGIDLSRYDAMSFDIRYTGQGRHRIKVHLMNFEPDISTPGDWNSQRFNEVQLDLPPQPRFTIPMNALRTADWWRSSHEIPLSKSYVRLDHVTSLEIATDDVPKEQPITLEVRSIRFTGKWISKTTLLTWLVVAWIACGVLGLTLGLLHFRASLSVTKLRLEQLAAVDRERKAAEAAREAALAEAVGLARERSNFLAQMSHELRTPLNAIIGYAQLLRRERLPLNERQAAGLATIHESGQHLLTLINDILDLARVEAGKMDLHPAPVHLGTFLRVVVDIMRVKAEEKGLSFNFELAPGLPDAVTIDETRLRQVLLNLLGNAVKFTDRGSVSLRVTAAPSGPRDDAGTTRLRFDVADSGIGIGAQQLGRLFQPFEQVADAQRRAAGTGLGLAISRQLVRLMGGDIQVASEPGKGSTFSFELAVRAAAAGPAALPSLGPIAGYEGERKRLMIVDDVPQNRAMLVDLLQETGFVVAAASNGLECLVLLDSFKPDLIVMDVMMPVIDGNETTRRIRRMPGWGALPIIAVTASVSPEDERKSREAGADAFLGKPVNVDVLLDTIGKLLSLTWISAARPAEGDRADAEAQAGLVVPPPAEIDVLWQLVRIGSMRDVRDRADYLQALDPAYAPFAARLRTLAEGYHSKTLAAFVARYRTEDAVPPP